MKKAKEKTSDTEDYLTLFFMIEKDISPKALDYVSICLKLKQFKDGMNFCKRTRKNHHHKFKDILTFYLINFLNLRSKIILKKRHHRDHKKNHRVHEITFFKRYFKFCFNRALKRTTDSPSHNLLSNKPSSINKEGQLQFTINGIIQTMNQCREVTPPDSNLLTTNRHLLLQLYRYSLTPEQFQQINEEVMRDIQDFTSTNGWSGIPCTQHPLTVPPIDKPRWIT